MTRARLLLLKQDRVSVLEGKLRELDQQEQRLLFLGSFRRDCNPERESLLYELDRALADYGNLSDLLSSFEPIRKKLIVDRCTRRAER